MKDSDVFVRRRFSIIPKFPKMNWCTMHFVKIIWNICFMYVLFIHIFMPGNHLVFPSKWIYMYQVVVCFGFEWTLSLSPFLSFSFQANIEWLDDVNSMHSVSVSMFTMNTNTFCIWKAYIFNMKQTTYHTIEMVSTDDDEMVMDNR